MNERVVIDVYPGTDDRVLLQIQTNRTGKWAAEDLVGVTRAVLRFQDRKAGSEYTLDSDTLGFGDDDVFDLTQGSGLGNIILRLGASVAALIGTDDEIPANAYPGRLVLYGVVAGRTYTNGWTATNDLLVRIHNA